MHSADIQDRDGGVLVMATLFGLHPFLLKLYADGGYQGPIFQSALRKILRQIDVEIVKRSDIAKGFAVLPKRWIVERTIAWLNRCRRLAENSVKKDPRTTLCAKLLGCRSENKPITGCFYGEIQKSLTGDRSGPLFTEKKAEKR